MFEPFPKIARLNRDIVITEKLDGTNAALVILTDEEIKLPENDVVPEFLLASADGLHLYSQSRTRLISPQSDNFGFARWAQENSQKLFALGPGRHFGEWWGSGIQRTYGLTQKKFSLFNVARWGFLAQVTPEQNPLASVVGVVPTLYSGKFSEDAIHQALETLRAEGSKAVPGFMKPEGIVIFHTASSQLFKVTLEKDEQPKGLSLNETLPHSNS